MFTLFQKFGFSNFENELSVIRFFRNRKSISLDNEKLAFMISIDFNFFDFFHFVIFHQFIKKISQRNYVRKSFAIFRSRDKYLNKEFDRYLLPSKWLWTDFFVREYFLSKIILTYTNVCQLAKLHFFWKFRPRSRVLHCIALHCIALHCLHCMAVHCIALHCIP